MHLFHEHTLTYHVEPEAEHEQEAPAPIVFGALHLQKRPAFALLPSALSRAVRALTIVSGRASDTMVRDRPCSGAGAAKLWQVIGVFATSEEPRGREEMGQAAILGSHRKTLDPSSYSTSMDRNRQQRVRVFLLIIMIGRPHPC
jgi:hypothetical protein